MKTNIAGILCCYNSEEFIATTLDSIFNQTTQLDRLIIVDDCSKDNTLRELKKYIESVDVGGDRVTILKNAHNLGTSMSANLALMSCEEKYAVFFSHDDINHPERITRTMEAFSRGAAMVCSNMDIPVSGQKISVPEVHSVLALAMALSNVVTAPTVALDLEVVRKHKLYFNPQNDYAEDYDLWCRCILMGIEFHVLPESLVSYRLHDQQTSVVKKSEQKIVAERIRLQYMRSLFPFFTSAQIETLVTLLLYQQDMIGKVNKSFVDLLIAEMDRQIAAPSIRMIYDYIKGKFSEIES